MLVIAHRGASALAPENSMEAFGKAVALGADGIELDVRTTSDGVAIVMHDATMERTAGMKGEVSRTAFADVRRARLVNGEPVPTLEEVFEAFAPKAAVYAELKDLKSGQEAERLAGQHRGARITVSSFDPVAFAGVRRLPKALVWDRRGSPSRVATDNGCAEIHLRMRRANAGLVQEAHVMAMRVIVWDVSNPRGVSKAMKICANGIIADDISAAKEAISRCGKNI